MFVQSRNNDNNNHIIVAQHQHGVREPSSSACRTDISSARPNDPFSSHSQVRLVGVNASFTKKNNHNLIPYNKSLYSFRMQEHAYATLYAVYGMKFNSYEYPIAVSWS